MSDSTDPSAPVERPPPHPVVKARHDLRNPLGHIMGFGELLLERAKRQAATGAIGPLQELVENSEQILDELNHGLDPRRVQAGQTDLSALQVSVQRFCRRVIALASQAQTAMGQEDRVREDVTRIVDSAARMEGLGDELLPPLQGTTGQCGPSAAPSFVMRETSSRERGSAGEVIGLSAVEGGEGERLAHSLVEAGYQVQLAGAGGGDPAVLAGMPIDVLLIELDLDRPESIHLLEGLKDQQATSRLPVMVLAQTPTAEAVGRALRAGAQDVLRWPLQADLLLARMGCVLALKRLHDQERALLGRIAAEQTRTDQLLSALLPSSLVSKLRRGERFIGDHFTDATVVSSNFGGLSRWAGAYSPDAVVRGLTDVFSAYDKLCQQRGLPSGRVVGDSYQVVAGVPESVANHVELAAELALSLQRESLPLRLAGGRLLRARVGLHSGPVSAGVLGEERLTFEVWGETVELARVLRTQAPPGAILTSASTAALLRHRYVFESAPSVRLDDGRLLEARVLLGKVP